MQEAADAMSRVARTVALALAEQLGHEAAGGTFPAGCDETTCFLRLNRYPACPFALNTLGLVPHTDSDFLTVLCQDQVGGLQLMMDSRWVAVKPRPDALIVNIGDLFQVTVLVRPAGRCHSSATTRYRAIAAAKHLYVLKF
jgi:isopenicillin N synthase-like dioxygenase